METVQNKFLKAALGYHKKGLSVIPCNPRSKKALVSWKEYQKHLPTESEIREWWTQTPDANVAIVLGEVSGIITLEVDDEKAIDGQSIPITPQAISGGKKLPHFYFRCPSIDFENYKASTNGKEEFSIRGNGQYVLAPPSIHPSGNPYTWAYGLGIHEVGPAEPPDWIWELIINNPAREESERYYKQRNNKQADSLREYVEELKSKIRLSDLLVDLGVERTEEQSKYIQFNCPFHESEGKKSFTVWDDIGVGKDWHDVKPYDAIEFIRTYRNLDFKDALDFLAEYARVEHYNFASDGRVVEQSGEEPHTPGAPKEDLKHLEQEGESKSKVQTHPKPEPKPIDLLAEPKPSLHPAMDWVDEKLIYGIGNGNSPIFIFDRRVIDLPEVSRKYSLAKKPQHSRFSSYGIKTYVNGAEMHGSKLYGQIHDLLSQHVIFKASWQISLVVIWIIGTYLHRCFPLYPYLWIQSPTKRCGKTRLVELLSELAFNSEGIQTAPTEAVLYRLPTITAGTLCWDEAENLKNHKQKGERLEILNTAYRKGSKVPRCEGKTHRVNFYEVFRPIALAGISVLPDTVADRSIKVELIRKRRDEKVKRLQIDRLQGELQSLRDGLYIFALERAPIIVEAYDQFRDDLIPKEVDDRLRDAFEVLISIAAGVYRYDAEEFNPVLNNLQTAARTLSGIRSADEDDTAFVGAINIIKSELDKVGKNDIVLRSEDAVGVLRNGGLDWVIEPKDARKILRKLGFESRAHRREEGVIRGYLVAKEQLEDLLQRYGG